MHVPANPLISLSTDFGPGNKGIGVMKAVILEICPDAQIIDLAHDITGFGVIPGARLLEATAYLPVGFHICVVDPSVGTSRKPLAIKTGRGDILIGPDNGVLIPATRFLGGIAAVHEITNPQMMRQPVSAIFHGRDIFAPAAAHLAAGVKMTEVGPAVPQSELATAAYDEAMFEKDHIDALIVDINNFGSVFLNVMQAEMHKLSTAGKDVTLTWTGGSVTIPYRRTFGDVPIGKDVILDDDFGRVEIAVNQGNFSQKHGLKPGGRITLS